tara:strand:- start:459 stop:1589 length:1131 start_codon:yes stop_codon:yes gene_type:complete
MILDIINLFVTFLCFIIILMTLKSIRYNNQLNWYFIIIIILVGLQRLQTSLLNLNLINFKSPFETSPLLPTFFIPVFLLFYKNSFRIQKNKIFDLIHFVLPLIFILLNELQVLSELINKLFFFLFSLTYWIMTLLEIIIKVNKRVSKFSYNKILSKWLILMFINTTIIIFFLNYHILYWNPEKADYLLTSFYRGSALAWVLCLLYAVLNPVIVFGSYYLLDQLDTKSSVFNPWSYRALKKIQARDIPAFKKLSKSIPDIIFKLKSIQQDFRFLDNEISIKKVSSELKIPNSHLKFILKYYNHLTIHEYLNFLKIILSLKFIYQGFLHEHTIESLSVASNFKSRITFFNNFKKYTGKSPSEFVKFNQLKSNSLNILK